MPTADLGSGEQAMDPAEEKGIELVFGLVGPTGVDSGMVCEALCAELKAVRYEPFVISVSDLFGPYLRQERREFEGEYDRIKTLMDWGTGLRESTKQPDIAARLAIAEIRSKREERHGDRMKPIQRAAYVVRSFRRPEELKLFRDVYEKAFTAISVYAPRQTRIKNLARRISASGKKPKERSAEELATELVARDHAEETKKLGQRMGETFPLSDFFVTAELRRDVSGQLRRLVRLTFGDPYISPTRDEQAMFFASAAALRSLDLSRQVGAAIVSIDGEVLSTGCNEVPRAGGGLYWGEDADAVRDFEQGYDSNVRIKRDLVEDAFARLRDRRWLAEAIEGRTDRELAEESLFGDQKGDDKAKAFLKDSRLFDVIEFGRAVHAEMASIARAARVGVAVQGSRLFCTTFPCHICARHIVASGIREVVFIEPYEKSRSQQLFDDSISVEPQEPSPTRTNFRSFVGVAPRRYWDFFQMAGDRKTKEGKVLDLDGIAAKPRIERIVFTYLSVEDIAIRDTEKVTSSPSSSSGATNG
jgi:deoxycytidylate deaminase